jgi:hypothetical protein
MMVVRFRNDIHHKCSFAYNASVRIHRWKGQTGGDPGPGDGLAFTSITERAGNFISGVKGMILLFDEKEIAVFNAVHPVLDHWLNFDVVTR